MTKAKELQAYRRGEGCLAKSADDEPLFILCARDCYAPMTVREWAKRLSGGNGPDAKVDDAIACAQAMEQWQAEHGSKIPD